MLIEVTHAFAHCLSKLNIWTKFHDNSSMTLENMERVQNADSII